jgi:hypothetical protein
MLTMADAAVSVDAIVVICAGMVGQVALPPGCNVKLNVYVPAVSWHEPPVAGVPLAVPTVPLELPVVELVLPVPVAALPLAEPVLPLAELVLPVVALVLPLPPSPGLPPLPLLPHATSQAATHETAIVR